MPTELGMTTIELLTQYFPNLIDVPFSAHMENELDAISEHKTKKGNCPQGVLWAL